MDLPGRTVYLDPLLPVAVRHNPAVWPLVQYPAATTLLLVLWEGGPSVPGVASPPACPAIIWPDPTASVRLGHTRGWLLAIGHRVIQDISVGVFGEPGLCNFLSDLLTPGWATLGRAEGRDIDDLSTVLCTELDTRPPAYRARVRSLLSDLMLLLYRSTLEVEPESQGGAYRLSDVIDHIEKNYPLDIKLADLGGILGCSASHLSRVFSKEVGVPPLEYVNRVRIRHACELLRATDLSITQISLEVGYNNLSFFNRYFRRIMQRTPREYRRYVSD